MPLSCAPEGVNRLDTKSESFSAKFSGIAAEHVEDFLRVFAFDDDFSERCFYACFNTFQRLCLNGLYAACFLGFAQLQQNRMPAFQEQTCTAPISYESRSRKAYHEWFA